MEGKGKKVVHIKSKIQNKKVEEEKLKTDKKPKLDEKSNIKTGYDATKHKESKGPAKTKQAEKSKAKTKLSDDEEEVKFESTDPKNSEETRNLQLNCQKLLKCISLKREIVAMSDPHYKELKSKIEKVVGMKSSTMCISQLLSQELLDADVFDKKKHFDLIELLILTLKNLGEPGTSEFKEDN